MQTTAPHTSLPATVQHFSELPPSARIDSKALRLLLGITNYATFSRRLDDGSIPDPDGGHNMWLKSTVDKVLANYEPNEEQAARRRERKKKSGHPKANN